MAEENGQDRKIEKEPVNNEHAENEPPKKKRKEARAEKLKAQKLQKTKQIVEEQRNKRINLEKVSLKSLSKLMKNDPEISEEQKKEFSSQTKDQEKLGYQIGDKRGNLLLYALGETAGTSFTKDLFGTIEQFFQAQNQESKQYSYIFGTSYDKRGGSLVKTADSIRSLAYSDFLQKCSPLFRFASGILSAHVPKFHESLLNLEVAPQQARFGAFPNFSVRLIETEDKVSFLNSDPAIKYGFTVIIVVGDVQEAELKLPAIQHSVRLHDGMILVLRSSLLHQWYSFNKPGVIYEMRLFALSSLWESEQNHSIEIQKEE
ncbi:calnexin independence factor Cif1 [Schizosaccharomyces cryophilus OY26]|uniref:Calnexin independence factor Cif1 n=1 Tax=Schizosaccharomyces cryophilus (strain OY26 / ATCC MYA-4695 / CBS 11777 / NBRC 106824 / NRRL Y48691) TaxID=653667 RepID=S9VV52_SCHCR|nr:calnexin independence factor Cif1 [Schizosaccharomyces cryophilus OY26]EPY49950.1 calnexin independence factor Cif1 [Schizosaccharomyces cryophilus OY26]